jgi:hypothetical protein
MELENLKVAIGLKLLYNSIDIAHKVRVIDNDIVSIAPLKSNLCAFQAVFNAARSVEMRRIIAAGNLESPAQAFMLSTHGGLKKYAEKVDIGYNANDFVKYLEFLKERGFIESFVMKRKVNTATLLKLLIPGEEDYGCIFMIFGWSGTLEKRITMQKKTQLAGNNCKGDNSQKLEAQYKEWVRVGSQQSYKGDRRHSHAVALSIGDGAVDEDGDVYMYCNGLRQRRLLASRKQVPDFQEFGASMIGVAAIYTVKLFAK